MKLMWVWPQLVLLGCRSAAVPISPCSPLTSHPALLPDTSWLTSHASTPSTRSKEHSCHSYARPSPVIRLCILSLAIILLFRWNPFLNHTYLPNALGSIPPSHLTDIYQWFTIIQKIKSRSLRMALKAPKPVLLASILNCSPGNLGLNLPLPLLAMKSWASQLPLNVSFHTCKMGITKLTFKANILPTPPACCLCSL